MQDNKKNTPYVDSSDNYKPQWYADMMYSLTVSPDEQYREAMLDKAIDGTLSNYQALKRKIRLEDLIRSKQLYEAFRAKAQAKRTRQSWRSKVNYVP